jgi:multiple sugar transport system substrate-binding protein
MGKQKGDMHMRRVDRRGLIKMGAAGLALGRGFAPAGAQTNQLSVLTAGRPDPRPPGTYDYANDLLDPWKLEHDTSVTYDIQPLFALDQVSRAAFDTGAYVYDLLYNSAMIPEYGASLLEIGSRLPEELVADLAPSQAASVSWQGQQFGVMPTLSLMLLFYNRNLFDLKGLTGPPTTWDELKGYAAEFQEPFPTGLMAPWGAPAGIGSVTSYWVAFLQQAGGTMYDDAGQPVFDDAPGVDALQLMIDLLPSMTGDSITNIDTNNLAFRMQYDGAAMSITFPAFWEVMNGGAPAREGKIVPAVMPAGPESNATVASVDAWTVSPLSPNPDLAMELIEFYLSPEVQKRQWTDLGWLPARLSVLESPEIQAMTPVAAVLREQANAPFDSFVSMNYMPVTLTIGSEIQKALRGEQTASQALTAAKDAVRPLLG